MKKLLLSIIYMGQFAIGMIVGMIPLIDQSSTKTLWCKLTPANNWLDLIIFIAGITTAYYAEKKIEKL